MEARRRQVSLERGLRLTQLLPIVLSALAVLLSLSRSPAMAEPYCVTETTALDLGRMAIVTQRYADDEQNPAGDAASRSVSVLLPNTTTRVDVEHGRLSLVDLTTGVVTDLGGLHSGDAYRWWRAIHPLADGWVYVAGAEYDSAIRLEQRDGEWTLTHNLRILERNENPLEWFLRKLFRMDEQQIMRDRLTGLVEKQNYRFFSPALRAMLFLKDGEIFDEGRFRSIGRSPMRWYFGDVTSSPAALIKDAKGKLFAYDGRTLAAVYGPNVSGGWINRPIPTTRTFLGSNWKVFEVRGTRHDDLRLVELVPTDGHDIGWYYTVVLEGEQEPLVVGRRAVYALEGDRLVPIWRPEPGHHVSGPAQSNRLANGNLLITTETNDRAARDNRYWLLSRCSG